MSRSPWRQRANRVIADVLAKLPPDASFKTKRSACNAAYPFGDRKYTPYRHWLQSLRAQIGKAPEAKVPKLDLSGLPNPAPTGNETVDKLLRSLRSAPWRADYRLILADAVEELLGKDAQRIRTVQPRLANVAWRVWPHSQLHYPGHIRGIWLPGEVQSRQGKFIMSIRDLNDMIEGRSLLIDPEIAEAAEIERSAMVLRMFGETPIQQRKQPP